MNKKYSSFLKQVAKISYFLGSVNLLVGLVLMVIHLPANAAGPAPGEEVAQAPTPTMPPDCTPPNDWHLTTRLLKSRQASKEWSFNVGEPEMDVTLEFFYYQDYDRYGCPYTDCSTGECQKNEIGSGESPLGTFDVSDGKLGPDSGKEKQIGRLLKGSYTASFWVTDGGSINIGLKVHKKSAPTDTPVPPPTSTSTPTPTTTATFTPTFTPTATTTDMGTILPPSPSDTPTPTATQIGADTATPTLTSTPTPEITVLPPPGTSTATLTWSATPPDTLEPPSRPSGTPDAKALIPVTGFGLGGPGLAGSPYPNLFLGLGVTILGLGVVAHGMGRQLDK
ncbi:MAG TPA: hypothetical protein VJ436_11640 [Anaerolineales bacterium]|nr:hypothetical protein [Anaerolineales bacterium]